MLRFPLDLARAGPDGTLVYARVVLSGAATSKDRPGRHYQQNHNTPGEYRQAGDNSHRLADWKALFSSDA
jgi:hypothetical protein